MCSYLDRRRRINVLVVGCLLACVVFLPSCAASGDQGPMAKLVAQSRGNLAAVKTLVLREEVTRSIIPDPGWRESYVESTTKARDEILKKVAAEGGGEAALAGIERDFSQRLAQADALAKIHQLNSSLAIARCRRLDFVGQRGRTEEVDRRDLDALLPEAKLDRDLRASLSRSNTFVARSDRCTVLPVEVPDLAVVKDEPRFQADQECPSVGLVPSWVVAEGKLVRQAVVGEDAAGPFIDVSCRHVGKDRDVLSFRVRPARAYRIETWTIYQENGQPAQERRLEDYRLVQDVWLPFKTSLRVRNAEGEVILTEETKLLGAEVNVPLDDAMFEVPAGLHVQDIRVN